MKWYDGGIAAAIGASKDKGAIFVVYIKGEDEKSTQITEAIDKPEVVQELGSNKFVAIKLEARSVPHQQFSEICTGSKRVYEDAFQIHSPSSQREIVRNDSQAFSGAGTKRSFKYTIEPHAPKTQPDEFEESPDKNTPVPSLYFIGKQGKPLAIITEVEDVSAENIVDIMKKAGIAVEPGVDAAKGSDDLIVNEQQTSTPPNIVCDGDVCTIEADSPSTSHQSAIKEEEASSLKETSTAEEKVIRAKELVEKKRAEKQKEEEEKERLKEIERRKMGQNVQNMKRWQDDQELKQLMEEREREKKANQAARDRVLAQIAQDKAERAAKFSTSPPQAQPSTSQAAAPSVPSSGRPIRTDTARIQFKLPDGKSVISDFPSSEVFETVQEYVRTNLQLPLSANQYTLSTIFPRRVFTDADKSKTLLDLQLVPTAVILIVPSSFSSNTLASNRDGGLISMLWYILTPFMSVYGFLKNFLFGVPDPVQTSEPASNKRTADSSGETSKSQPKRRAGETTVIKRHGNVHRLGTMNDSDDENNTWNGNSTQQM